MNSPMRRVPSLFSRSLGPNALPRLVVMLVHLDDLDQPSLARRAHHVDHSIRAIESNGALTAPAAFQWLVVESLYLRTSRMPLSSTNATHSRNFRVITSGSWSSCFSTTLRQKTCIKA